MHAELIRFAGDGADTPARLRIAPRGATERGEVREQRVGPEPADRVRQHQGAHAFGSREREARCPPAAHRLTDDHRRLATGRIEYGGEIPDRGVDVEHPGGARRTTEAAR